MLGIGGDGNVWADDDLETTAGSGTYFWTGFNLVSQLTTSVTSISATDFGTGYAIFATTGKQSYVYENQNSYPGASWKGWTQFGGFVATSLASSSTYSVAEQGDVPVVVALGADGRTYRNVELTTVAGSGWTSFLPETTNLPAPATTLSVVCPGDEYLSGNLPVLSMMTGPVSYVYVDQPKTNQDMDTNYGDSGWNSVGNFVAISSQITYDGIDSTPMLVATGYDGKVYVNQSYASSSGSPPYVWYGWVSLGFLP